MDARPFRAGLSCFFLMLAASTTSLGQEPAKAPEVPVARPVLREVSDFEDFTGLYMDAYHVNDFHRFGRTWRVEVRGGAGPSDQPKDIAKLKIRTARGQLVPLGALVAVRETEGPTR